MPPPTSERAVLLDRLLPALLLLGALSALLTAGLLGFTAPWHADPARGVPAATYTQEWVDNHLEHGLGVTLAIPVLMVTPDTPPRVLHNWHHPPLYPLYLTGAAHLLGREPPVLRAAHLLLWLPGVLGLFLLVRRHGGPLCGATAALLFASCPWIAYFGAMVLQDGITLSFGLLTCWQFQRHLDTPSRVPWWIPGTWFFLCCSIDVPGYLFGLSLLALALLHPTRRAAMRSVVMMFGVSLAALGALALHYGIVLGGPSGFFAAALDIARRAASQTANGHSLPAMFAAVLTDFGAAPLTALTLFGLGFAAAGIGDARRLALLAATLALPGIVSCLLFPLHAAMHAFWALPAAAGVATAAAIPIIIGVRLCRGAPGKRALGAPLVVAGVACVIHGLVTTPSLVGRGGQQLLGELAELEAALQSTADCSVVLTSADIGQGRLPDARTFVGRVDRADTLDVLMRSARHAQVDTQVAFLLPRRHRGGDLHRHLATVTSPQPAGDVLVFRLRTK